MGVTNFSESFADLVAQADLCGPEGLLAFGGNLAPETLLAAYREGVFPWPIEGYPLAWFCPEERAILEFSRIHVPRSLARIQRQVPFELSYDRAFEAVIHACSQVPRPGQQGTWITPEMIRAYIELHSLGYAHSVEAWEGEKLVGGIYGVWVDGVFSGESMFHLQPNASKLALLHLVEILKSHDLEWIDIQVMTPHMEKLGARLLSRDEFLRKLARTRARFLKVAPGSF